MDKEKLFIGIEISLLLLALILGIFATATSGKTGKEFVCYISLIFSLFFISYANQIRLQYEIEKLKEGK